MPDSSTQQKSPQITIRANEMVRSGLEPMIQRAGLANSCAFENCKSKTIIINCGEQETKFALPVRIGVLFDQILMLSKKAQKQNSALLDLKYGILDINLGKFIPSDQKAKTVLLTEKEVEILQYLHESIARKIPRDELLKFVWGYAKNTETHTLETHIYRLRRKIELDPASPEILKKDEDGYFLG